MPNHAGLCVLVVEDEPIIRIWIASCLELEGFIVLEAADGEEALAFLKDGYGIDVVFTDIRLGHGMNGWEVAEAARQERPRVGIVYTSGNIVSPRRDVAASEFLPKPYQPEAVIRACLGAAA